MERLKCRKVMYFDDSGGWDIDYLMILRVGLRWRDCIRGGRNGIGMWYGKDAEVGKCERDLCW